MLKPSDRNYQLFVETASTVATAFVAAPRGLNKSRYNLLQSSSCPYVALHTTKIHTPITLGIHQHSKAVVFRPRKRRPCGLDFHRPLHFSLSGPSAVNSATQPGCRKVCPPNLRS